MEALQLKIINKIDSIEDVFEKRQCIRNEQGAFLQQDNTEEDVELFAKFIAEQKTRIQQLNNN